ncbi:MAG: hypothetical protein ABIE03_01860 [Patescibacteria group bacterium]
MMTKREKQKVADRKEFLRQIRKVFEPRYKRKLTEEKVEIIATNLTNYAKVCHNAYSKMQGKLPMYQV